ncbi:hypothetical protein [Parapedobacter sp.]
MVEIEILFYVLKSFFGFDDGRIVADKTTIHIYPQEQRLEIIQTDLFAVIQSEEDTNIVLAEWDTLLHWKEKDISWAEGLDGFSMKCLILRPTEKTIESHLILGYSNEKDLRAMGIWYDRGKGQFSINHNPANHIQTESGKLVGNYWVFDSNGRISFTIEPFLRKSGNYQKFFLPSGWVAGGKE